MRKIYQICSLLLCISAAVHAQEQDTGLYVNLKNGESRAFRLEEVTSLTFNDSDVSINGKVPELFSMQEIRSLTIQEFKSVSEQDMDSPYQVVITRDEILFPYMDGGKYHLSVYSADGAMFINENEWQDSRISISHLPANRYYILKLNDKTFKFKK